MDIEGVFIEFKRPYQFYYAGTDGIEAYRISKRNVRQVAVFEGVSLFDMSPSRFGRMLDETGDANEIGIILNSGHFIFNILEFQRIPFRESLRRDLIEWKIKKVFPEEMDQYEHHFFQLNKSRVLSVLLKRDLKARIEHMINGTGRSLVYLGNSTVEIINTVFRAKGSPDFFLEIDGTLTLIVFQSGAVPYYIRKFRFEKNDDFMEELSKTLTYVSNSFGEKPVTYSLISNLDGASLVEIQEELKSRMLQEVPLPDREQLFLPVRR